MEEKDPTELDIQYWAESLNMPVEEFKKTYIMSWVDCTCGANYYPHGFWDMREVLPDSCWITGEGLR